MPWDRRGTNLALDLLMLRAVAILVAMTVAAPVWADEQAQESEALRDGLRSGGFSALGFAAASTVMFLYGHARVEALEDRATSLAVMDHWVGDVCGAPAARETCREGERWETITTVSMVATGVGVATGVALLYASSRIEKPRPVMVVPAVGRSLAGAALTIEF
jgi:hypothetical protein